MMAAMGAEGFQSFVRDLLAKEIAAAPAPAPSSTFPQSSSNGVQFFAEYSRVFPLTDIN